MAKAAVGGGWGLRPAIAAAVLLHECRPSRPFLIGATARLAGRPGRIKGPCRAAHP